MDVDSVDNHPTPSTSAPAAPSTSAPAAPSTSVPAPSFFENKEKPCQPDLKSYPKRMMGSKMRRFNKDWYKDYKWLEYNQDRDACFCFPCRVFLATSPEKSFTETGFRDWKHAEGTENEKKKGLKRLDKHDSSHSHQELMSLWTGKEIRAKQCSTIQHTVSQNTSNQQQ